MPSVATWWCGQAESRRYVLEHLDDLVIMPTFPGFGRHPEFPASMNAATREKLIGRIEAHPEQFVAQEQFAISTAPVYTDTGLASGHVLLRVFAAWDGQSYTVLPGGLTRVSTKGTAQAVSIHRGAGSKDTWVPGGSGEPIVVSRPATGTIAAHPSWANLPSRVADNLFWLGRYAERLEDRVRLLRALLPALSGEEDFGRTASVETVVRLLTGLRVSPARSLRRIAWGTTVASAAPAGRNDSGRERAHRPGMESQADAPRSSATEGASFHRYVASAAAD